MSNEVKRILFDDLEIGMIIKVCAGRSIKTRRIYKADTVYYDSGRSYKFIWSIPVVWSAIDAEWIEQCDMISNAPHRFNKIFLLEDGVWNEYKLEIIC